MITEIEWKNPSPPKQRNWRETLEQLKARPGKWAQVAEYPTPSTAWKTVHRLRNNVLNVPTGNYEFRHDGCEVFARYLGETEVEPGKVKGALLPAPVSFGLCTKSIPHWSAA